MATSAAGTDRRLSLQAQTPDGNVSVGNARVNQEAPPNRDASPPAYRSQPGAERAPLSEKPFTVTLCLERKRAERSGRHFILMLVDASSVFQSGSGDRFPAKVVGAISATIRETDILGWYQADAILGVILTELGETYINSIVNIMKAKVSAVLLRNLTLRQTNEIHLSFHLFPEEWDLQDKSWAADSKLYPDLSSLTRGSAAARIAKRSMDVVGSALAMMLLSPLFLVISAAIKLTSKGPALFRQKRVGQYGVAFTFLKFRSMHFRSETTVHKDYVRQFIAGKAESGSIGGIYKLSNDPRVTRVGRFLRKTSLDELPQFLNVLKGEMSLVGPRPPLPYELEAYDRWHRRRLLEAKPGITGLWQVHGRSKTTFDDMVRLDLQYAMARSLWLDLKILAKTPAAVLSGEGAY